MERHVLLYVTCFLISSLIVMIAWEAIAASNIKAVHSALISAGASAGGGNPDNGWQQQHAASSEQGIQLLTMPEYEFYWVGNSTIPGAGLGTFARTNLPAGTLWNHEDAEPSNTLALTLPLWQSLTGLARHITAAGHSNHPVAAVWSFFDVYAYTCSGKLIVSLTGSTFTNHAPAQQTDGRQLGTAGLGRPHAHTPAATQLQGRPASMRRLPQRYANSESLDVEGPVQQQRQAQGVTPWQICTVLLTLRDVQAGEELLEDYLEYDPLCRCRGDCPEFLARQPSPPNAESGQASRGWTRAVLVQSLVVTTANSSSSTGGGLGVFAARDLPAGTVWNKEDAAHSLVVTREQWMRLLQLHVALEASGVSKPLISRTVDAFRSYGFCCPLDGRMYVPFTTVLLAKRRPSQASRRQNQGSSSSSSSGRRQQLANAVHVEDAANNGAAAGMAMPFGASIEARCTWLQTTADVQKGEELVVAHSQHFECGWPGMQL